MSRPFSGWREGLPWYGSLLAFGIVVTAIGWSSGYWMLGVIWIVFGLCALAFFRDPIRSIPPAANAIVSPADGTVVAIEEFQESEFYNGRCRRVSIFLSVFNVHINRAPFDGTVQCVVYKRGRYKNAMAAESSRVNESNTIWLDTPTGPMTVRQISGAIARRIVCVASEGAQVGKGEKIGMIKFGSRTELYLPAGTEICVNINEKVRGGTTIVARAGEAKS